MQRRQIIKPQMDVPIVVKLDSRPEGTERDGKFGVDYQYIVNDDRGVMWLPREARDQLVRCGAQQGDEVQIVKSMRGRVSLFSVQVVPDSDPLDEPPTPPRTNGHPAVPGQPRTNGHALAQQTRTVAPSPAAGNMATGYLCSAIDAAVEAAAYAKEKHGWPLQFDAEQVRRLAITLMIGAQREDR